MQEKNATKLEKELSVMEEVGMKFENIHKCLAYFQSQLKVGKNEDNTFAGYKYRNIAQINDALKPLIARTGAVILNYVRWEDKFDQAVCIGVADFHYNGDSIQIEHMVFHPSQRPKMDPSLNAGATSTNAMRYALQDLFLLGDDSVDPDKINDGKVEYEPTTIKKNIVVWDGVEYDYNNTTEREAVRSLVKKYIYTHTKAENATIYLALKDVNSPLLNKEFIDWVKDSDEKYQKELETSIKAQ
jgi:hypothetical protein